MKGFLLAALGLLALSCKREIVMVPVYFYDGFEHEPGCTGVHQVCAVYHSLGPGKDCMKCIVQKNYSELFGAAPLPLINTPGIFAPVDSSLLKLLLLPPDSLKIGPFK